MDDKVDSRAETERKSPMAIFTGSIADMTEKCRSMPGIGRIGILRDQFVEFLSLRKIKGLPDRMATLSVALRSSAGNESPFLEMGRTLQSIYADTAELIRYFQDAIQEVMGDAGDNILNRTGKLAKTVETALTRRQGGVAADLNRIRDVADHLGGLHQACDELGRIAMNLRVVGLNIGVESTRSERGRAMFSVVSKEILKLSEKVDASANRIREDATAAMAEQMQAFETISGGLQVFGTLTSDASGVVSDAKCETENGITAFLKAFETADIRFKKISDRVGEVVMGLQFHDSMRQRIEHISDALDDSGRIFRGQFPDRDTVDSTPDGDGPGAGDLQRDALGRACRVVALQKMQLADVIKEIERVCLESMSAFGQIDREILEMDGIMSAAGTDIRGLEKEGRETLSDPFSKLAAALTGLGELLRRGDRLGLRIEESVSRAAEIGRGFSVHLDDVNAIVFETKIKALNAIVKAGHMNEDGRTLEVLAQEMNRLSEQTNGFVAGVEEKLTRVGEFGNRIQSSGKGRQEGGAHTEDTAETLAGGIEAVIRMRALMTERVAKASERAGALRTVIARTLSDLGFLRDLADEMSGHLGTLDVLDSRLAPLAAKWEAGTFGTQKLTGSYTMERERLIHGAVFSTDGEQVDGTAGGGAEKTHASEADGDISLWGDDPDASDAGGAASLWEGEEEKPGDAGDIFPPGNGGEDCGKTSLEEENDDADFGENMELF